MIHSFSFPKTYQWAAVWALLWALSFVVAMSAAKLLTSQVTCMMVVFVRCFLGSLLLLPLVIKHLWWRGLVTKKPLLNSVRAILMCGSVACTYYTYSHLPLPLAASLGFVSVLMTVILAVIFFKESINFLQWGAILIGYSGTFIMVHPGHIEWNMAIVISLCGSFMVACNALIIRRLVSTEPELRLLIYGNAFCALLASLGVSIEGWMLPNFQDWLILGLIAVSGTFSQYSYIKASQYAPPSFIAPFDYTRLVFALPLAIIVFNEFPTIETMIGTILIVVSTAYIFASQRSSQEILRRA